MINIEEVKVDDTLPYGANADDILNLINAIKTKQGNDQGIKQVYGKLNIENSRKILKALGISLDGLNLSDVGRRYAYETNDSKKQLILLELMLKYSAYEYFLLNISNNDLSETPLENIQNYWGKHNYGNSEYNRNNAAIVFGQLIELSGLGIFKIGRKGKVTRIEWNNNAQKLIRQTHTDISLNGNILQNNIEQVIDIESSQLNIDPWLNNTVNLEQLEDNSCSHNDNKKTNLAREILEKDFSNEQQNNRYSNIDISVNIDMTDWQIDKIISFFKATQGIFENSDES